MTKIIAIETATEACSAAVIIKQDTETCIRKRFQLAPREHTKLILPMLDEVLDEFELRLTDMDAIAFGRGPGAFTGLRIASGIAQGLALSVDKPTIPVSSLKALALASQTGNTTQKNGAVVAAIDARMGEVYWAEYSMNNGLLEQMGEEQLTTPEEMFEKTVLVSRQQETTLIGSGWDEYIGQFKEQHDNKESILFINNKFPEAEFISQLALEAFESGELRSIEEAQPVYLRNNVAEKSKKQI